MTDFAMLPPRWRRLLDHSDDDLANTIVTDPVRQMKSSAAEVKSGHHALADHLIKLEKDHIDRPLATLQHAALVVLIRRELALDAALQRYFDLWDRHRALLLQRLSLRWLVSAADTLADHGRDPAERATGFAVTLFVNTIKLYETERMYQATDQTPDMESAGLPTFDLDGIVGFRVERGDTVGNMYKRKDRVVRDLGLSGQMLDEVMRRVNEVETVYARFRSLHKSKLHSW